MKNFSTAGTGTQVLAVIGGLSLIGLAIQILAIGVLAATGAAAGSVGRQTQ